MQNVAILGASTDRSKFGNKAVRAYAQRGFTVWPVNLKEPLVEGFPAYASLADVPGRPDLVSVYLPPPVTLKVLPAIAAKGCDELWLNPGCESDEVVAQATAMGLKPILDCSIVELGVSPAQFSD